MSQEAVTGIRVYDSFAGSDTGVAGALDPQRWEIVRMRNGNGTMHCYRDRNARVRMGNGRLHMSVKPFTRFHDTDPLGNNAKLLYLSTEHIPAAAGSETVFSVDMAVMTHAQVPYDLLDAYGTANLVDFATGTVINVAATNDTVYVVHERLPVAGSVHDVGFTHRVVLDIGTRPGQWHHYAVGYCHDSGKLRWYVDGELHYWANAPGRPGSFRVGMGIFSARSLARFSRAERERGQGAEGWWGPWRVHTAVGSSRD